MGGKSSTSSSSVQIPPEVLARYNAVNARAETAAANPFQNYGGQFVAGLTKEQQQGVSQTATASQAAQPYYNTAAGMTLGASQDVGPLSQQQIGYYQNPFTQAVVDPTVQALQRQQGMQRNEQQARAIKSGAGFGDRAAIERATLEREQELGTAQAVAPLYQQGYQQATQTAMGQQGVAASDMARRLQAAQQLAGLGAGAQQSGIQGGQALLAAGTVGQQTEQADLTAKYQQFLQQQGYPFQTAQFLANIAMGTGALSGSTTSTTQPAPFFSDKRLKHDTKKIGETNDGLPIYSFKYNGDDRTQIGLMAQDVEKKKPGAVGLAPAADGRMYKTVDYDRATRAKKYAGGGLVGVDYDPSSMGGAVGPMSMGEAFARGGYAGGGPSILSAADHKALMAANVDPEAGPYAEQGIYKTPRNVIPGLGGSKINMGKGAPAPSLVTPTPAGSSTANQIGLGAQALSGLQMVNTGKEAFNTGKTALLGSAPTKDDPEGARGLIGGQGKMSGTNIFQSLMGDGKATGGLVVPRSGYALEGAVDEKTEDQGDESGVVIPGMKGGIPLGAGAKMAQLATAKSPSGGGGGQRGPGNDIMDAFKLGKTAMDFGSTAMEFLPAMFLANGGAAERRGYAGDDGESGAVIDPGLILSPAARKSIIAEGDAAEGGSDTVALAPAKDVAPPREYKISPQRKEDMEPHWQQFINRTYSGEGGFDKEGKPRYNIRQGGLETFDPETGHPGPGKPRGGESSAAGAGQFIHGTWNRITGGAPMTEAYQDAATKELAMQDYKARTGRDLDADLRERGLSADILGTLSPTWTSFRKDGSPQPAGLTFGRSGEGKYSGKEASQASLGDVVGEFLPKSVPTGSNFWVPALSGIGSMLSSKSPYLLGAVGEGLVGGVSGYQAQKKEERETVKNIFDLVKGRFTQTMEGDNIVFRDNITGTMVQPGQVQAAVSSMLTSAGIDPAPYGLGRTQTADAGTRQLPASQPAAGGVSKVETKPGEGAPANAAGATQDIKAQVQALPTKSKEEWGLGDYKKDFFERPAEYGVTPGGKDDPNVRQANIIKYKNAAAAALSKGFGDLATRNDRLAEEEEKRLEQQISHVTDLAYKKTVKMQENTLANADKWENDAGKFLADYDRQKEQLLEISRLQGLGMQTGYSAESRAKLADFIQLNFGVDLSKQLGEPRYFNYAAKVAAETVRDQIAARNLGRAPASMSQLLQKSSPDPNINSGAVHLLLGQALGDLDYTAARDSAYLASYRGKNPNVFINDYKSDPRNKDAYNKAIANAYSQLYVPEGDPKARELVGELSEKFKKYGYSPRVMSEERRQEEARKKAAPPNGEAKTEAPAAPAVPAPLQNMEGLQYSASRNQYRDKAGNVYDASGKRVQ
jgi:muramidase (phage lysozyme)